MNTYFQKYKDKMLLNPNFYIYAVYLKTTKFLARQAKKRTAYKGLLMEALFNQDTNAHTLKISLFRHN